MVSLYNKQQEKNLALACMCPRFDLNADSFHDVGPTQKVVRVECP